MSQVRMTIDDHPEATVVGFDSGTGLETGRVDAVAPELYALVDQHRKRHLILDFSGVVSIGSHALGILLTLYKKIHAIQGRVAFCGVSPALQSVFEVTNLHRVFEIHPDLAAARKAMRQ